MNADLILVLDKGCIVQMGTHEDLLEQEGIYRQIFDIQTRIEVELENEITIGASETMEYATNSVFVETTLAETAFDQ
jgi:ABC-type multidrug transport system ATPase subunit